MSSVAALIPAVAQQASALAALRRDLHAHPELGFEEQRTAGIVAERLAAFQPAEEGRGGAQLMLEEGLFERFVMEAVFGMHNWPGLPAGSFAVSPGPVMASANTFKVVVQGKGSHARTQHAFRRLCIHAAGPTRRLCLHRQW